MRTMLISLSLALVGLPLLAQSCAPRATEPTPELVRSHFDGFDGCFLLTDLDDGSTFEAGSRCDEALPPCSTFKLPHSLIGLQTGAIDTTTRFEWDGQPKAFKSWQRDHNLATAFQNSVVWAYQDLAQRVGAGRMHDQLYKLGYGQGWNDGDLTSFWLDGSMRVTARDQIDLMVRLLEGDLPFDARHVATMRSVMDEAWPHGGTFGGKTGTCMMDGKLQAGWYLGHLDSGDRHLAFVTLIRADDDARGHTARKISKAILSDLGF